MARLHPDTGELLNAVRLGGTGEDFPTGIVPTLDGGAYLLGRTTSTDPNTGTALGGQDAWLCKLGLDLSLISQQRHGGSAGESGSEMVLLPDGSLCFVGGSRSTDNGMPPHAGGLDLWVVKLQPGTIGLREEAHPTALYVQPNPATDQLHLQWTGTEPTRVEVLDHLGRVRLTQHVAPGTKSTTLGIAQLAPGLYTVRVVTTNGPRSSRFFKH